MVKNSHSTSINQLFKDGTAMILTLTNDPGKLKCTCIANRYVYAMLFITSTCATVCKGQSYKHACNLLTDSLTGHEVYIVISIHWTQGLLNY